MVTPRGVRVRRTALGALVLVFCAGAGILAAALGLGHHAADGAPGTSHPGGPPSANSHPVLQVMPAPYQLPAPVTRAVALPDQRGVLIAGGLDAAQASTNTVTQLDPVTGQTSQAGLLAVATHDAAGAMLNGRPVVFGGGSQTSIADVQAGPAGQAGAVSAAPRTGPEPGSFRTRAAT